jgi:hypothetical protein
MLIESAFSMLPEYVAGFGFPRVKREANAVGSIGFALLNALHAKNILDPIQRIQLEQKYETKAVPLPNGSNRQCDIFLDYGGSKLGSAMLANYGWRYRNYVEAKFFKSYHQTPSGQDSRSSVNSAEAVADLIRLIALVPEPQAQLNQPQAKTSSARYFVCLSDRPPMHFINKYLTSLHSTFESPSKQASISLDLSTGKAAGRFSDRVGLTFNRLNVNISRATCFSHYPLDSTVQDSLWMLLIRIDSATITMTDGALTRSFAIGLDRGLTQSRAGDYDLIRRFVATNIR